MTTEQTESSTGELAAEQVPSRTLPCFKCGKILKPVFPDGSDRNQPYEAVTFDTHGQYGSAVFDEFDGAKLEINVCDECLVNGKEAVLHRDGFPKRKLKPWDPSKD